MSNEAQDQADEFTILEKMAQQLVGSDSEEAADAIVGMYDAYSSGVADVEDVHPGCTLDVLFHVYKDVLDVLIAQS